jgi:hypothetical protein
MATSHHTRDTSCLPDTRFLVKLRPSRQPVQLKKQDVRSNREADVGRNATLACNNAEGFQLND